MTTPEDPKDRELRINRLALQVAHDQNTLVWKDHARLLGFVSELAEVLGVEPNSFTSGNIDLSKILARIGDLKAVHDHAEKNISARDAEIAKLRAQLQAEPRGAQPFWQDDELRIRGLIPCQLSLGRFYTVDIVTLGRVRATGADEPERWLWETYEDKPLGLKKSWGRCGDEQTARDMLLFAFNRAREQKAP